MTRLGMVAGIGLLTTLAGPALAQEGGNTPPGTAPDVVEPPPPPERNAERLDPREEKMVSLTLSPVHLLFPIVEVTAEVRPVPHLGLALIGGVGQLGVETIDPVTLEKKTVRVGVQELGGQAVWYPLKPFHSLQVGAEALYVHISTDELHEGISGIGDGLAIGPFVGYKVMSRGGFTFVPQLGAQYITARAKVEDSEGNAVEDSESDWIVLLNLNLGWSI